jgi:glycosyltransferase involved in cell wall biosynthesis
LVFFPSVEINSVENVFLFGQVGIFQKAGADASKMRVIPNSIDVDFFNPRLYDKKPSSDTNNSISGSSNDISVDKDDLDLESDLDDANTFQFLSVFLWQRRKGWDALLRAYWKEFSATDPVSELFRE